MLISFGFCNFCVGQGKDTMDKGTFMDVPAEVCFRKSLYDKPEFPGGDKAFNQYLLNNLRYPSKAKKNNIHGLVKLSFTVEPDGSLTNIKIVTGLDKSCNKEALRVIKNMPKWIPGKKEGKDVAGKFILPIKFSIKPI